MTDVVEVGVAGPQGPQGIPGSQAPIASGPTSARPSAVTEGAGAQFFDTTLGVPIWSDGAVWRNAAGASLQDEGGSPLFDESA